jgi:hypothetical protein
MRKLLLIALLFAAATASAAEPPETILSYFYPKDGKDAELAQALRDNIAIMKKLDVIEASPVVLLRATDAKERPYFVEIFTWRSAGIPDAAPPEIRKSWATLESLCEARDGKRGIVFDVVELLRR